MIALLLSKNQPDIIMLCVLCVVISLVALDGVLLRLHKTVELVHDGLPVLVARPALLGTVRIVALGGLLFCVLRLKGAEE